LVILLQQIAETLDRWAPECLAESWDNTGLLLGDRQATIHSIMTCLTVTPTVVQEAVDRQVDLIVTHHPLPFRPLNKITTDQYVGGLLWRLATCRIQVLSLHTRYDSMVDGINHQLAQLLKLDNIRPLEILPPTVESEPAAAAGLVGRGRWGSYPAPRSVEAIAADLKANLRIQHLKHVAAAARPIQRVAIGCGSAGEFLGPAATLGCDLLVLGETNFHGCLEAQAAGVDLLLTGHYASERFAMEALAGRLATQFPEMNIFASQLEQDPIRWL